MKKHTFLLALLIPFAAISQKISYSFGEPFKTLQKHADMGFYRFGPNQYAEVYYRLGESMIFRIFDESFKNIKKEETVLLSKESKKYENEGFFSIKNDFFWFYFIQDKKTKTESLFALPFDENNFKFAEKEIQLVENANLDSYGKYKFNYSTDSTKLLITYRVMPTEKKDKLNKDIIGFNLFDDKMNKLYSGEIQMPYSEYDMNNLDYEVDSRGNIYVLTEVKLNNSLDGEINTDSENKNAYRYELIRVDKRNNSLQRIKISLNNKYTNSVILSEDLNHDIVITGYYSDKRNSGGSNGAYIIHLEYDSKDDVKDVRTTYCEFPAETLKAYENERAVHKMDQKDKDGNLEARYLSLDKISFSEDGSVLIVGEEYYYTTHIQRVGSYTYYTRTHYYNDILVLKADKNGKTIWCNKIPKQQSGIDIDDLSYHHHSYNGEDYFFYLDNIKNIDLPLTEAPATHSSGAGGYLTCVKIDKEGKMTKRSIFNIRDEEVRLFPRSFESISKTIIVDRLKADKKESKVFRIEIK